MFTFLILIASFCAIPADFSEDHPIHLSVTELYPSEAGYLEMSITFFMDDFGDAINYDQYRDQINNGELSVDDLIMRYLSEKTSLELNGKAVQYELVRKETNFPALTCYLKVSPEITDLTSLSVENTMMLELFDDQRNMVHVNIPKKKGSLILDKKKTRASARF